jgi:scyllo-inositol 2-dehydrogenase (NADP+)
MPAPIRVGLVGYGYASQTFHRPLLAASADYRIAAVASSSPDRVAEDLPDVPVVADVEALAGRDDVDLVVLATPPAVHTAQARTALLAGKHVVVEKPFVPTVAEADELIGLARPEDRVLSAFQNRRWDGDFLTAKRLIETGELGEVLTFRSHFDRFRPAVRDRWRERPGRGSGMLYDLGAHLIDQALVLFGAPETVWADSGAQREGGDAVDYAHLVLRWGRRRAILHTGMVVAEPGPRFAVHGTQGSYLKYGLDPQEDALKAGRRPGDDRWGADVPEAFGTLTRPDENGDLQTKTVETEAGDYPAYYSALARALRGDGPNPVPAEEARDVIRVIELAQESAESGRTARWDEA